MLKNFLKEQSFYHDIHLNVGHIINAFETNNGIKKWY